MPQLNADLSGVRDEDMGGGSWRALEPGEYVFRIVESDYRPTKKGDGMVLELKFECLEPGRRGKVWEYLTLEHPNTQTVRIAHARLKELALAVGHPQPDFIRASEELHMKPCVLLLKKEKADRGGDANGYRNTVMGFKPAGGVRSSNGEALHRNDEPPPHDDSDLPF